MYGYVDGYTETDGIDYCPKCGSDCLISHSEGVFVCLDCGYRFSVVEVEE